MSDTLFPPWRVRCDASVGIRFQMHRDGRVVLFDLPAATLIQRFDVLSDHCSLLLAAFEHHRPAIEAAALGKSALHPLIGHLQLLAQDFDLS